VIGMKSIPVSAAAPAPVVRLVKSDGRPPAVPGSPHHRRWRPWLLGLLAGVAVVALGTWLDYGLKARLPAAPAVLLARLDAGPVGGLLRATGSLTPVLTHTISQPIAGQIAQVRVSEGEVVKAGQVLARFDSLALRAELARAEARLVAGEAAGFEAEVRLYRLAGANPDPADAGDDTDTGDSEEIAKARLAAAVAEINAREAAYRLAARQVGQGIVRAPVGGVVIARRVEAGQTVAAGAPLFELASEPDHLVLMLDLPEAELARVAPGLPARFTVPAFPGRSFRAQVSAVNGLRGPLGARRLPIALTVDNPGKELVVGMTASVEIASRAFTGGWRAPVAALSFVPRGMSPAPDQRAVWVEEGTALRQVEVEVGAAEGGFVELRAPALRAGTAVAVGYAARPPQPGHPPALGRSPDPTSERAAR
jgi:HlyD family secretion protein